MMRSYSDTIFALATSKNKSALAVFRVTGKKSILTIKKITNKKKFNNKSPTVTYLLDNNGNKIDQVVVVCYNSPQSYTGEDMVEISCHGSISVINKITETLIDQKIRIAEPGEFTKRALINDKLSLIQAETINELVNSETENQRKIAINNLTGGLDVFIKNITKELSRLLANVEAIIDFADEDLPNNIIKQIKEQKKNIIILMDNVIKKSILSKKIYEGYKVTVLGKPNTGKSSFINYINNEEVSIVTNIPGTTTDLVTSVLDINGHKFTFVDTAGLRKYNSIIEKIGIERSIESAHKSDLSLVFLQNNEKNNYKNIKNKIFVKSKYDKSKKKTQGVVNISSFSGFGIKSLLKNISKKITKNNLEGVIFSRERHIQNLNNSVNLLKKVNFNEIDIAAENIRKSITSVQKINQKFDIEKILDIIFSDFCIGK